MIYRCMSAKVDNTEPEMKPCAEAAAQIMNCRGYQDFLVKLFVKCFTGLSVKTDGTVNLPASLLQYIQKCNFLTQKF